MGKVTDLFKGARKKTPSPPPDSGQAVSSLDTVDLDRLDVDLEDQEIQQFAIIRFANPFDTSYGIMQNIQTGNCQPLSPKGESLISGLKPFNDRQYEIHHHAHYPYPVY